MVHGEDSTRVNESTVTWLERLECAKGQVWWFLSGSGRGVGRDEVAGEAVKGQRNGREGRKGAQRVLWGVDCGDFSGARER